MKSGPNENRRLRERKYKGPHRQVLRCHVVYTDKSRPDSIKPGTLLGVTDKHGNFYTFEQYFEKIAKGANNEAIQDHWFEKTLDGEGKREDLIEVLEDSTESLLSQIKVLSDGIRLAIHTPNLSLSEQDKATLEKIDNNLITIRHALYDNIPETLRLKENGKKDTTLPTKEDALFEDFSLSEFTEGTKQNPANSQIAGNVRLSQGMYRTSEEQEEYKKESLERELP